MYFWTKEIKSIDWDIVTLSDWNQIQIEEKNKELFTEEAITASDLQANWIKLIAKDVVDALHSNNARLIDIDNVFTSVRDIINWENEKSLAKLIWKDKLNVLSTIFWSEENLDSLAVRNIRMKDIF